MWALSRCTARDLSDHIMMAAVLGTPVVNSITIILQARKES
jgi:hypothetical protein